MKSLGTIVLLGARVVLASLIALSIQIILLVNSPDHLLQVQEGMKNTAANAFAVVNVQSQYQVAYNLIGGDNIIVHTFFVLIAYIGILLILLPFKPRRSSYSSRRRKSRYR